MSETDDSEERTEGQAPRWRLIAFRVAVVLFTAILLLGLYPALKGIVPIGSLRRRSFGPVRISPPVM